MVNAFKRAVVQTLSDRASEPRRFLQALVGPRQTGKTTAIKQVMEQIKIPAHYVSADDVMISKQDWLRSQWQYARSLITDTNKTALLVIDEIQNILQWSTIVKAYWDEDTWQERDLRVIISGSAPLLLQSGLAESLMGRFEIIHNTHWGFKEVKEAFDYSLEDFLVYGGYPGAAKLIDDRSRWLDYMSNSIIEPTLQRDVIGLESVRKPALMRSLLILGLMYSGREISYRKIQGQLDDAGNTTTLAHYLQLLGNAGLISGIQKYDTKALRSRSSTPRLIAHNTGLITAVQRGDIQSSLIAPELRGHLVESAVGAYLLSRSKIENFEVFWWRGLEISQVRISRLSFEIQIRGSVNL